MFVSLDKGNSGSEVAMAEFDGATLRLTERNKNHVRKTGFVRLSEEELFALCKHGINQRWFRKEDL